MALSTPMFTPYGKRIGERALRRGMRLSILAGTLGIAFWSLSMGMPLTMCLEALGASGLLMGMVSTLVQLAMMLQVPAALLAERMKSRKGMWGGVMLVSRLVWLVAPFLLLFLSDRPLLLARILVLMVAVSSCLGVGVSASWFSWMADLVPDKVRGRFWGMRQSATALSSMLAMWWAGWMLDRYPSPTQGGDSWFGFIFLFLMAALVGAADIVLHLGVPEPRHSQDDGGAHWLSRIMLPMRNHDFRRLTIAMGLYTFSVGLLVLGIVYLKKDFGVTYSQLSALTIMASLGTIAFGVVWGYVLDRIGGRAFGCIMMISAPILMLVWFFLHNEEMSLLTFLHRIPALGSLFGVMGWAVPDSLRSWLVARPVPQAVWVLLPVNFLAGALYGGIGLFHLSFSCQLVPRNGRTLAMAVHWSLIGLVGALGPIIAGRMMDFMVARNGGFVLPCGMPLSFHHIMVLAHMAIVWLAVVPLLLRISRPKEELQLRDAISRLFVSNPLRAVTNIYLMGAAVTSQRRARAARELGQKRTAIAVGDLIERLDDASSEVREESAQALGEIASPEAVDALISKLEDPESDLAPQVARALRKTRDPRGVEALLRRLFDGDRETKSESARALGEIGDRRAVPSLLETLAESSDSKIISSSSEALSRLGELAAIYEILPRMRDTLNPVLKRSLAVAVGDLLGGPEGFYKVLSKENKERGSESERLLKEVRKGIQKATRKHLRETRELLMGIVDNIESCYEDEEFDHCANLLFDLSIGIAALRWGLEFGDNSKAFVNDLIWRDQGFGVGVWCLDLLRQGVEGRAPDYVDVMLGLYFLSCRGLQ